MVAVKKARANEEKLASPRINPFEFVGDVKEELGKVTWTTQDELRVYTKIVVGATFSCGMVIYFIDVVLQNTLFGLNAFVGWISG